MQFEDVKVSARSNPSQRIIAVAIVFAALYFATEVVVPLLLAVLLAYFLDPVVGLLERIRIPRAIGALVVMLAVTALFAGLGYLVALRANQFLADWPRYSSVLRHVTTAFDRQLTVVQKGVDAITPIADRALTPSRIVEPPPIRDWLLSGVGSLYSILVVAAFVPFLVFFMLAAKPRIWKATIDLFPDEHQDRVRDALDQLGSMLRSFVVGNALISAILMLLSYAFFLAIHLKYPFLSGCVSGILNLVPYLGAVLAWLPPFLIGMAQWNTVGPYFGVAVMLTFLHIMGLNVLMPAIVGRRVHLNALAVTISLLFWGWLWGAVGLILAIPITAAVKVICDHSEGWEPVGRWLGA
ncbi:MAG TPA: AI-2E family transporter [Candidatus Saccharimonadales bacterium]|jgi:predicted PurR-regulated permease PerM|nr:AI-2E family transporter [Candidatus Saccharimonadales bacterium]